jgi:hypothetical protein
MRFEERIVERKPKRLPHGGQRLRFSCHWRAC